jgi:hypothetical protein
MRVNLRIRLILVTFIAFVLSICIVASFSTLAICRVRADHPGYVIDMEISEFLGQNEYTAYDLMRHAEQNMDRYFGLMGRPARGAWTHGVFHCRSQRCELHQLRLELAIRTLFPCWIDEYGTTWGLTDFKFDISENNVQATTVWYDRPILQAEWSSLATISPTMTEAVASAAQSLQNSLSDGDTLVNVYAKRNHWLIRFSTGEDSEDREIEIPFRESET